MVDNNTGLFYGEVIEMSVLDNAILSTHAK